RRCQRREIESDGLALGQALEQERRKEQIIGEPFCRRPEAIAGHARALQSPAEGNQQEDRNQGSEDGGHRTIAAFSQTGSGPTGGIEAPSCQALGRMLAISYLLRRILP